MRLLNINKWDIIDVAAGLGKIGIAALISTLSQKSLKVTLESFINVVTNVRNSIRC